MVHVIFLLKTSHLKEHQNLFHNFWIKGTRDMIFAKTAQTLNHTKEKDRLTGGPRRSTDPTRQRPESRGEV